MQHNSQNIPDYAEVWAPFYDALYESRLDLEPLVMFLTALGAGRSLLEFGIGTGRVSLALARKGWRVSGIELSQAMLEILRVKPGGAFLDARLGDFTKLRLKKTFDVVLLNFNTLFLLRSQDEQVKCFENAARHLRPGGQFVVETFVPDHTRWNRGQSVSVSSLSAGEVDLVAAQHDRAGQTILAQHVLIGPGGIRLQPTFYRYAWPAEIDLMARIAGLKLKERWAGYDRAPFTPDSTQHVSVYTKA
jgi:SAM-dependent methyltransferase